MNRLLVILLAASFALTAVAAISDPAVGAGPSGPAPAVQQASPAPVATDARATGTSAY